RDDSELRPQLEYIPVTAAEHADRRRAVGRLKCAVFVRQQPDEHRFPGAVRTDDRCVLARTDGERDPVEDAATVLDDGRGDPLEYGFTNCACAVESGRK